MEFTRTLSWNPAEHSDEENLRWSWLRSVEWGIWPAFLSGPIVPLFLPFYDWWKIIGIVAIITTAWALIRYKYVNVSIATCGAYFVLLKWITCPIAAVYLTTQQKYILAVLSLMWPMLSAFLGIFVGGTEIGVIQKSFMNKLGYEIKANIISG